MNTKIIKKSLIMRELMKNKTKVVDENTSQCLSKRNSAIKRNKVIQKTSLSSLNNTGKVSLSKSQILTELSDNSYGNLSSHFNRYELLRI